MQQKTASGNGPTARPGTMSIHKTMASRTQARRTSPLRRTASGTTGVQEQTSLVLCAAPKVCPLLCRPLVARPSDHLRIAHARSRSFVPSFVRARSLFRFLLPMFPALSRVIFARICARSCPPVWPLFAASETCKEVGYSASWGSEWAWATHANKFSGAYAGGHSTTYSLDGAKSKCIELGANVCKAVTCKGASCTVRASATLTASPIGETSYVPSAVAGVAAGQFLWYGKFSTGPVPTQE